jgi:hypothetical protein
MNKKQVYGFINTALGGSWINYILDKSGKKVLSIMVLNIDRKKIYVFDMNLNFKYSVSVADATTPNGTIDFNTLNKYMEEIKERERNGN